MLRKLAFILFLLPFCLGSLFADNEDGEKPKKSEVKKQGIVIDSTLKDHIKHLQDENDDTLVFEDWEDPEVGARGNSAVYDNGNHSGDGLNKDQSTHLIGDVLAAHRQKKYKANFEIFPNPVVANLHLRAKDNPIEIRVINLSGELLLVQHASDEIDVSSLSNGLYFIQLVYSDHIESKKFVKS